MLYAVFTKNLFVHDGNVDGPKSSQFKKAETYLLKINGEK